MARLRRPMEGASAERAMDGYSFGRRPMEGASAERASDDQDDLVPNAPWMAKRSVDGYSFGRPRRLGEAKLSNTSPIIADIIN